MYYFIFICNNIILQQDGNKYSVPQAEEPPIAVQPWTTLQELPDFNGENAPHTALQLLRKTVFLLVW